MAITTVGFDGTVNEAQWARLMRHTGEVAYKHGVTSGLSPTPGGGARQVVVSSGTAVVTGVLVDSSASETLTLATNGGASSRTDYIVLRLDWTANTAVFAVVQGTSATAPALTQTEGTLWEMPVARVAVAPSAGVLSAGAITACKPLPRMTRNFRSTAISATTINHNDPASTLVTLTLDDPGWPYRLDVASALRFDNSGTGHADIAVVADSEFEAAVTVARGISPVLDSTGLVPVTVADTSGVLTGKCTVTLTMVANGMSAVDDLMVRNSAMNHLTVNQIPA